MVHVILSGGSGRRLWPLSREHFPKQFLKLYAGQSLFALTLARLKNQEARFLVVCNEAHYFHSLEEITQANLENRTHFLLESASKNTMNSLILAALACDLDEILVVSPTDHLMDIEPFHEALNLALKQAQENQIVFFGVAKEPSSQYGFIECSEVTNGVAKVLGFIEKPSRLEINQCMARAHGDFYINSGIFVFKASVFLKECAKYVPSMLKACEKIYQEAKHLPLITRCTNMQDLQEGSVDTLLWQRCTNLYLVPLRANWQDVGHFTSLQASLPPSDMQGNTCHNSTLLAKNSSSNYIYSTPDKLVCLLGLTNCVIADTKDALLVASKDHLDSLKDLVEEVGKKNADLLKTYPLEYRPWGSFEVLLERSFFKVKLLEITPHKRLSLQRHKHRSEHWVVVEGVASVIIDSRSFKVLTNESVFIKQGQIHRLGNDTDNPLKILEVQCGTCLDESDIERLEDDYKRI
ncbi:mannose-1-phosphate guanylyltransferase/mannose-6-phosphate isomerase [Helicobacter suis]|uniref:mannose-1-phosphate guanylyltransferase/mannose-6-phosphate isomerase n=1 Tax=Helicobacter suis TaxID=104628 RepID=UPI000CF06F84|nr:mannose-1-phosphate guanylyltransferase/mannose-6-phosphate isomerase [Helicobacter suis]BCD47630.1 Mannose-6-phosphate isomerase ManC [Helicobacter suis]